MWHDDVFASGFKPPLKAWAWDTQRTPPKATESWWMPPEASLEQLLLAADDSKRCENPVGFKWRKEVAAVKALKAPIERLTTRKFTLDDKVQDASFFADLGVEVSKGQFIGTVFSLRFSSFGRFFSTWSTCEPEEEFSPELVVQVIDVVRQAGFVYIPQEELEHPYTGSNPYLQGLSWWERFFDYL